MLDTRIQTETTQTQDDRGNIVDHVRNIPRITYTIVKLGVNVGPDGKVFDGDIPPEVANKLTAMEEAKAEDANADDGF
jgi:hypothetical protein